MDPTEQKQLERSALAGLFFGLLGHRYRGIAVSNSGVKLLGRTSKQLSLSDITHALLATKTLGKSSVTVPVMGGI